MTEMIRNQYKPDQVSPPGETLKEILELRGMSQAELAERSGRPKKTINEIAKGKAAITPETALQFELVLGIPATFWNRREQQYRESLARQRESAQFKSLTNWLDEVPYRAMIRREWIRERPQRSEQLQEVLMFFGVASPATWNEVWKGEQAAFRHSPTFRSDPGAMAAWLRKGELMAKDIECPQFDPSRFKEVLRRIRSLTQVLPHSVPSLIVKECASAGVCVVFLRELPGTRVSGATRWLNQTNPLMQLSLRYRTDDHLWFTFFHEAGHILLHGKRDVFLESEELEKDQKETEADSFAHEWLIPQREYRMFKRLGARSCAAISRFAHQLGIAPGIVVGRLQHDGFLPHTHCNELKRRIDQYFEGEDSWS